MQVKEVKVRDFNNRGSGGKKFNDRGRGRFDRGDRQLFDAVCSDCGKDCQVPFKPTGEKPVKCRECFSNHSEERGNRRDRRQSQSRSSANVDYQKQFDELNQKLETVLDLVLELKKELHKPTVAEVLSEDLKS